MSLETFLDPRCTPKTLDNFLVRRRILEALQARTGRLHGELLDIGCGEMPYRKLLQDAGVTRYIGLDLPNNGYAIPDLEWDGATIPMEGESVDCAMATEVFEHCPDPGQVMSEAFRVLRPGGTLFFTVPFLWPLHCVPHDEARYTPFALERLLRGTGFESVEVDPLGGWDASLAQMLGLWARRRPMPRIARGLISRLVLPAVWSLSALDRPKASWHESSMFTGFCGTARKPRA